MDIRKYLVPGVFSIVLLLYGCEYNSEEELFGEEEECADAVSFTPGVENIINTNCAISGCHVTGGVSPDLTSFEKVKSRANSIKHETGSRQMPPPSSGKSLSAEEIKLIACWAAQGAHHE